ncbi:MAG: hypothetical protein IJT79_00720 [Ruminococcus sp.]|nr:hypothetical protein [Ruminococcus sp.]
MNSIESELFDEFKYVDKICREIFNSEKGVSTYIEQMEMTPVYVKYRISQWENDYKQLKHIRWVRNQLAHETGYVECTAADVNWLKDFHNRLLSQQDPLAIVGKIERANQQKQTVQPQPTRVNYTTPTYNTKPPKYNSALWIALAVVGAVAAAITAVGLLLNNFR